MFAPHRIERSPALDLVAIGVFVDHAIRAACQRQVAVCKDLDELRAPFDRRATVLEKDAPGRGDFERAAPDRRPAGETGIVVDERGKRRQVSVLSGFAEADFTAPDIRRGIGGRGRGEQDQGDCNGEILHISKYTCHLVAHFPEE